MDDIKYYEPESVDMRFADDVFVKMIKFPDEVPAAANQHKHEFDHTSVVLGTFLVLIGDSEGIPDNPAVVRLGGPGDSSMVVVEAGRFHRFICLTPGGMLMCIHRLHDGELAIAQEAPKHME